MTVIITAYKIRYTNPMTGETSVGGNWYGDLAHNDMQAAITRMEELATYRPVAAVFYESAWLAGREPRYIIDKTDKSNASIRGLEGLVNSVPSDYL